MVIDVRNAYESAIGHVVKGLWEVFVWRFGVLFLPCVCVSVSGVLFSVGVCVCDLLIFFTQPGTVVIDVRNAYESAIGHFQRPPGGATLLDPKMRNSREFPKWINDEKTKEA